MEKIKNETPKAKAGTKVKSKTIKELRLIQHIEKVVAMSQDSKLSEELFEKCKPHTVAMAEKLKLSEAQCLMMSVFLDQSDDESIRIADLANHFGCRNINVMCLADDIDTLVNCGYIRRCRSHRRITYRIPPEVTAAIRRNEAYVMPLCSGLTIRQFFDTLHRLYEESERRELTYEELTGKINELIEGNPHLQLCKAIGDYAIEKESLALLLFFCHRMVNNNDDDVWFYEIENMYDSKVDFNSVKRDMKSERHELVGKELIRSKKGDDLISRDVYCLTDNAKQELLSEIEMDLKKQKKPKDIVSHTEITAKELFYNRRESEQIAQLTSLLMSDNFTNVQKRLAENGMRKGFACLFYGSPGTGKTETVYQIARSTGRDLMMVNVSEIKSMWVGESEKNIKALFDRYRNFCKQSAQTPILLFNEADAVIGIRQQAAERAVDKMENSIQNIILQEMENLDGIMIATTNLTQNLDKAFERRFLYKIEFGKPAFEAKAAIWRTMMPALDETEAAELARAYDLSGGQIENVARKHTVDSIINGAEPSVEIIHSYCEGEQLYKTESRRRIGY